jgi:hypothetical protein
MVPPMPNAESSGRPLATALLIVGHVGLAALWIGLVSRSGDPGGWLSVAVVQAAVGLSLGLLERSKARPLTLLLMPSSLVWLAGLALAAVQVAALARHLPHVHPLAVMSAWYAGVGRVDLPLAYATWLASFGFLATVSSFAAASRARRDGLNLVVVGVTLAALGVAGAVTGAWPSLDASTLALFGGLTLVVLVGDAPVTQRLGAGLAWVAAVWCAAEVEVLWARGALVVILEAERDAGALGMTGGLDRLALLEGAMAQRIPLVASAIAGALATMVFPRPAPGTELWRRPLAAVGVVVLALPVGIAAKADRDARGAGVARALEEEAKAFDPAAPVGGNRDRVDIAPVLELRGERVALMGDELPVKALDEEGLLKEAIAAARLSLFEKLHEDLPTRGGWRPPPDRATVVVAVSARAPAAELLRALRLLELAGMEEAQLLLRREPPDPAHPLAALPLHSGVQPGLDVPRAIPVALTRDAPTARLDAAGLRIGESALARADLAAAMRVAELVGRSHRGRVVLGVDGGSVEDVIRALDPARAVLQLPVAVSVAPPPSTEEQTAISEP